MSQRVALAALLSLVAATAALPARAEIDASGTRLSIAGGPARFYMTYGHPADPELYAPIMAQLRRAGVSFERQGDDYLVYVRGIKKETWPIVDSRDNIPENGAPCVLVLGGNAYVPVRAAAELGKLAIRWEKGTNLVAINPTADPRALTPAVQPKVDLQGVTLSGVQVEQKGATVLLRIKTSAAIRPQLLRVSSDNNPRLCLDFLAGRWADGLVLPAGMGDLKAMRIGYPDPRTARLVIEVPGVDFNFTRVQIERDEVVATLSRGIQARSFSVAGDALAELRLRDAVIRRAYPQVASSKLPGRNLDNTNVVRPTVEIPVPFRNPAPEVGPSLRFNPAGSLQGRTVVVDAGHGGRHSGASGLNYKEKDLCLKMSFEVQRALEGLGARVIMTRTTDIFVSLDERCQVANQSGADIFVSIHCNSMPRRNMQSGSETYWHSSEQSRRLARALHPRLVGAVQGRDGGIRNRSFQVIRETRMPSVLLEIAYINNTKDEILLADGDFHRRLADNLALGVLDYFGTDAR